MPGGPLTGNPAPPPVQAQPAKPVVPPVQWLQPAPPPVNTVHPIAPVVPPVQWLQPAPPPVQWLQPAPPPVQWLQPAPPPVNTVHPIAPVQHTAAQCKPDECFGTWTEICQRIWCSGCSFCQSAHPVIQQEQPVNIVQPIAPVQQTPVTVQCHPYQCTSTWDCSKTWCGGCSFCQSAQPAPPPVNIVHPVAPVHPTTTECKPDQCFGAFTEICQKIWCSGCSFCQGHSKPLTAPHQELSWRDQVKQTNLEAQAYVNTAIRTFNKGETSRLIAKWFGGVANTDPALKQKVQKTLNSVKNMLGFVEYVYPGPECKPNTYAYVYPYGPASRDTQGHFLFFLCDLYMRSSKSVQIETLTHEGSHHSVAYLDDVSFEGDKAYGRQTCERLAFQNPEKAVKNADSFCYYVQDITDADV
jgi:hypothetical protein